jgi:hypothetical protein
MAETLFFFSVWISFFFLNKKKLKAVKKKKAYPKKKKKVFIYIAKFVYFVARVNKALLYLKKKKRL